MKPATTIGKVLKALAMAGLVFFGLIVGLTTLLLYATFWITVAGLVGLPGLLGLVPALFFAFAVFVAVLYYRDGAP